MTDDGNFISNPGEGHDDLSELSDRMKDSIIKIGNQIDEFKV